jgi:hypothetical protein
MALAANPFASLIDKSLPPDMGASGVANPFLQPQVASGALASGALASGALASGALDTDTSSDGSWTDEPSFLFKPLPTRSRAVPIESIIKRSMTQKRIKDPSSQVGMQCMQGQDGKYYYIPIDPYNESHLKTIIEELSPLLVNPTPSQFQKGALYTYIIASIIRKNPDTGADIILAPPTLYTCQAQNMFEFGTKHHHIFFRMALTNELANVARENHIGVNKVEYGLYASGEMKCIRPTRLKFNYFSGTYKMRRKIPPNRVEGEGHFMEKLMSSIDPNYVMRFDPKPFIVPETMSITREQLRGLNSKDIPTFGFDTSRQCHDMQYHFMRIKNTEKRIGGLEEMKQKYEQIMNPPPVPAPTNAKIMGTVELTYYAKKHGVPIPAPYNKDEMRKMVQAHMDTTKGKGGGNKKTIKKRKLKTMKKKHS